MVLLLLKWFWETNVEYVIMNGLAERKIIFFLCSVRNANGTIGTNKMQTQNNFFSRWKQGMKDLSPTQLINAKLISYAGTVVGILFAWYFLILRGMWYFSIILFFAIVLQVVSFVSTWQQKNKIIEAERMLESQDENLKKILEQLESDEVVDNA